MNTDDSTPRARKTDQLPQGKPYSIPSAGRRRFLASGLAASLCALLPAGLASMLPASTARASGSRPQAGPATPKNILIITGSARVQGNSDMLAEAFAAGARSAGHTVSVFRSAHDKIDGCIACDACWSRDKPCAFDDGFNTLGPLLERAEVLVLCSPLYWYTLSTHLKSAVDKMYAYMRPQCPKDKKLKIREAALLMCAETWFSSSFDGPVATYKSVVGYTGWKDRGMVLAKRVGKKGAIEGSGSLREAEQFGREI